MRSDQYIGLTDEAQNFIESLMKTEGAEKTTVEVCDSAFNDGPIMGIRVRVPHGARNYVYTETLQDCPWSSGPMYFTHLQFHIENEAGILTFIDNIFSWVADPTVEGEVDSEKGHYWV